MEKLIVFVVAASAQFAENKICVSDYKENDPASGCYVQSGIWVPGKQVDCELKNTACLPVTCSATGFQASFRADLFDVENDQALYQGLLSGDILLKHGEKTLSRFGPCGYSFKPDNGRLFVTIDWQYGECDFDLELVKNEEGPCQERIHYSVSLRAEFVDSSDVIEFSVQSDVTATCSYCSSITLEANGMHINAEDLFVNDPGFGRFDNLFQCKFYTDRNHINEIKSNNMINMGTKVFGAVEASSNQDVGLTYFIDFISIQNDQHAKSFDVVKNGGWADLVSARVEGSWKNTFLDDTRFNYYSFGFDDYQNQHYLSVTCSIKLCLRDDDTCRPSTCDETIDGVTYVCPK